MIRDIGLQPGIEHIRVFNKRGVVIYSANESEVGRVVDRQAEACYQCHETGQPLQHLDTDERTRIFQSSNGHRVLAGIAVVYNEPACWTAACHAHRPDQKVLGVFDIGVSLQHADELIARSFRKLLLFGLGSALLICVCVGLLVQRYVGVPVRDLLQCTRSLAEGRFDCRVPALRQDEFGELAEAFNRMTEEVQNARQVLKDWADSLAREVEKKTDELRAAHEQLLRSEKLSSVGLLAAGVAHELNSPLMGILTFAHMLAKRLPEGSPERADVEVIAAQADRCSQIIRQLLDFARGTPSAPRPIDVHQVLDQSLNLVTHLAIFRNIEVRKDYADQLPLLTADPNQLEQVFVNLLMNAAEAMPQGGTLTVRTRLRKGKGGAARPATDVLEISFHDTGVGIPPEMIHKIFDPFFTSKQVGKGTGLGLAVSHGIVERHGGTIEVESTPGGGTTFTVVLPLTPPGDQPKAEGG